MNAAEGTDSGPDHPVSDIFPDSAMTLTTVRDFARPLVGEPHHHDNNTAAMNSNLYGTPISKIEKVFFIYIHPQ